MIFRCQNCGGNMVYDPAKHAVACDSCGSVDCESPLTQEDIYSCINCGCEIPKEEFTTATHCSACGAPVIFEDRLKNAHRPQWVLPFKVSKQDALEALRKHCKKSLFAPTGFLSKQTMEKISGEYVPYWLYDYDTKAYYRGTGYKESSHREGDYIVTKTKIYEVIRDMEIQFEGVPVDASIKMPDDKMQLMQPYEYGEMADFNEKFYAGFYAEDYNMDAEALRKDALKRVDGDTFNWIESSITGYTKTHADTRRADHKPKGVHYAMLPVWAYVFRYNNKDYEYYVNGQTGKVVGAPPFSKGKVIGYSAVLFAAASFAATALIYMLGVI